MLRLFLRIRSSTANTRSVSELNQQVSLEFIRQEFAALDQVDVMTEAAIVATLMAPPSNDGKELSSLPGAVKWLEVRADLAGDLSADWLRAHFYGKLLYTLRSRTEGGTFEGSLQERQQRLYKAGRRYDLANSR